MPEQGMEPLFNSDDDWPTEQQTDPACVERWLDALRIDAIHATWEREVDDADE
jgi:hypothetical protein